MPIPPSPERVASISPLARLCAGQYTVPTFIIHGTKDEVAPFVAAKRFATEMGRRGVFHGFLPLHGMPHLFDLRLREGSDKWEEMVAPGYQFLLEVLNLG